jgi:glycine cleavage system H protein
MAEDYYYHEDGGWTKMENDDTLTIDDFYQKQASNIICVDLPFEGNTIAQGETYCKILLSKGVGKFIAPISGEFIQVNSELENNYRLGK